MELTSIAAEHWHQGTLRDLVSLQRGHDLTWRDRRPGNIPVMGSAGRNGFHNTALVKGPGVVLGRSGASFGQAHYCEEDFWPHNTALYATDFRGNSPMFVFYRLALMDFTRHNTGGAQQSLNRNFIYPIPVAIPPSAEQARIVEALRDVDALLEGLDRLIAKKRDLKQAAMQQLITGRTRLPDFSGRWERVRAGDVGRFRGGSGFPTGAQGATNGDYPFFKVSDMNNVGNELFMRQANNWITEAVRKDLGAYAFPEGSVVFAKVGAAVFLERKRLLQVASCLDNNMAGFVADRTRLQPRFAHLALLQLKLGDLVSTTALPSLNGTVLAQIPLNLPPLDEQLAVVTVLSDIDAELAALEQRRDKTRLLKQGMMQELLTGRTRLV